LLLIAAGCLAIWVEKPEGVDCRPFVFFAGAVMALAVVWLIRHDIDWSRPVAAHFEHAAKYGIALLAIPALCRTPPPIAWVVRGCWTGAWLAGLTAAWQMFVVGLDRANGYTNAIPFGNIALLLAAWSVIGWRLTGSALERGLAAGAIAMGVFASLASGSRGGWLMGIPLFALAWWIGRPLSTQPKSGPATSTPIARKGSWAMWGVVLALGMLASTQWRLVSDRLELVEREVTAYLQHGESDTSIGQRLAHWKLAWRLGLDKPIIGWGNAGYEEEKSRRVQAGESPEVLLHFGNAHHEWLDLWAKAGLVGVVALAAFYVVPAWIYIRALRRRAVAASKAAQMSVTIAATGGLVTVVGFLGFGMTHKMLTYNSSNIMYLFMNLLWIAVLIPHKPAAELGKRHDTM